jgi:hypothetical protein
VRRLEADAGVGLRRCKCSQAPPLFLTWRTNKERVTNPKGLIDRKGERARITEYSFCFMQNQKPSRTAEYMALFRAVETAQPSARRLFEDPYAIPLLSGTLKALAESARLPIVGRLVPAFLDFGWPYTRSSAVVRTRMIDDLVREAIRAGAQQMVLLGAGFDSRAYRLEEAKTIPAFEVDHPATQRVKTRTAEYRGWTTVRETFASWRSISRKTTLKRELLRAGFDKKQFCGRGLGRCRELFDRTGCERQFGRSGSTACTQKPPYSYLRAERGARWLSHLSRCPSLEVLGQTKR